MAGGPGGRPTVEVRTSPDGAFSLSSVTVALGETWPAPSISPRLALPVLRRARTLGVTCFDLSQSASPGLSLELLAAALEPNDRETVIIVGPPESRAGAPPAPGPPSGTRTVEDELREHVAEVTRRLGGHPRILLDWSPAGSRPPVLAPPLEALVRMREERLICGFSLPFSHGRDLERPTTPGPWSLRSGSLSLLDVSIVNASQRAGGEGRWSLLARDVFAGGALDGSLLGGSPLDRGPSRPPATVAALESRFEPVLRLGFLTRDRGRTLARTALGFALQWPWVLTAVIPLPPPDRLDALLTGDLGPPLGEEDLRRLGVAPPPGGTPNTLPPS